MVKPHGYKLPLKPRLHQGNMLPGRQHVAVNMQHVARQQVARSGIMNFVDCKKQHVAGQM